MLICHYLEYCWHNILLYTMKCIEIIVEKKLTGNASSDCSTLKLQASCKQRNKKTLPYLPLWLFVSSITCHYYSGWSWTLSEKKLSSGGPGARWQKVLLSPSSSSTSSRSGYESDPWKGRKLEEKLFRFFRSEHTGVIWVNLEQLLYVIF